VVRAEGATKFYGTAHASVRALNEVSVAIAVDELTAIMGPSGPGKSILLHCMAGLDTLTSGRVFLGDRDLAQLSDRERTSTNQLRPLR
jgi:putative ABC transport system ATP-binding protein